MATVSEWIEGARPRTLPNAIAPVVAGVGAANALGAFSWGRSLLVALSLIIGVNFANDYSDGIRGTDENRVGPLRPVGSRTATPKAALTAALGCLGLAAALGLVLVALSGYWWLLVMDALCIIGAWFCTGGSKPYGYYGFGELAVFVFFGLAAVLGTVYVRAGRISWVALGCAVAVGSFSMAVLTANKPARHPDRPGARQAHPRHPHRRPRHAPPLPGAGGSAVRGLRGRRDLAPLSAPHAGDRPHCC